MKLRQTTIYDIARDLNISKSTVSRALTNHPEVKAETRKAVLELAEKLDYQRNMLSINLISRKSNLIGIIVPEFETSFFPQVVIGAQELASKYGYNVIVCQSNEKFETEVANTKVMLASQVDGILVSISKETRSYEHLKIFQKKGIPMVLFNRVCDELIVPKVVINDYEAAFGAVEHLIQTGKRRIAHLAGPDSLITSRKRLKGYLDALKKHKIPIDESLIIPYDFTLEKVKIYIRHLMELQYPPDGLFIANDPAAIEAIRTIKNMGIQIPQQIGIVGFSNDYGSNLIEPGLTTVDQPKRLIGSTAMQLLLDLIDKEVSQWKAVTKTLDSKLIVRNSSMLQESEPA
ncbi:LacI family DNA-binding transcriptional regulator [Daejeonella sp.]|jgi:LacI family transcriptional regulator/LacI family repressor for deo operon, udp, cdd, tsx, nupC, and nupG|uniref:LacI family DNA-binding transcriptional regulator n=1 Tax=Daejeonella sp. TaxID=2805397 RepID=UPI0037BFC0DD